MTKTRGFQNDNADRRFILIPLSTLPPDLDTRYRAYCKSGLDHRALMQYCVSAWLPSLHPAIPQGAWDAREVQVRLSKLVLSSGLSISNVEFHSVLYQLMDFVERIGPHLLRLMDYYQLPVDPSTKVLDATPDYFVAGAQAPKEDNVRDYQNFSSPGFPGL